MADFEDKLRTERGVAINGATVELRRSDSGAVLTSTTTGTDYADGLGAVPGRWKLTYDITTLPAGVYPDVVITNGLQVRQSWGGAQIYLRNINLAQAVTAVAGAVWDFTAALLKIPTAAPGAPALGHIWTASNLLRFRDASATRTVVTEDQTQTLTNKTLTTPTISGTGFTNATHAHAGVSSGGQVSHTDLTNKGANTHTDIDNHLAATAAHGATGAVVGLSNTQTLTNKTLTTPTIGDYTNAQHAHSSAATGGTVSHTSLSNIGSNSHATIDTHLAAKLNAGTHGVFVAIQSGSLNLASASSDTEGSWYFVKAWGGTLTLSCNSGSFVLGPGVYGDADGVFASGALVFNNGDSAWFYRTGGNWYA